MEIAGVGRQSGRVLCMPLCNRLTAIENALKFHKTKKALDLIDQIAHSSPDGELSTDDLFQDLFSPKREPLRSTLYRALIYCELTVFKYLLSLRPSVVDHTFFSRDYVRGCYERETLLHAACRSVKLIEFAKHLLERGASTEIRSCQWETPLHVASSNCNLDALELLLDSGADTEARNNNGYSPLLMAAQKDNLSAMTLLLKRGADIDAKTTLDEDVYTLAIMNNCRRVVSFLFENSCAPLFQPQPGSIPHLFRLAFTNRTMFPSLAFLFERALDAPDCPPALKADALIISLSAGLNFRREADVYRKFRYALTIREKLPFFEFNSSQEMKSVDEWDNFIGDRSTEFHIQILHTLRRCFGQVKHPTMFYIYKELCEEHINKFAIDNELWFKSCDHFLLLEQHKLQHMVNPRFSVFKICNMLFRRDDTYYRAFELRDIQFALKLLKIYLRIQECHTTCNGCINGRTLVFETSDMFSNVIDWTMYFDRTTKREPSDLSLPASIEKSLSELGKEFVSFCQSEFKDLSLLNVVLRNYRREDRKKGSFLTGLILTNAVLDWGEDCHINMADPYSGARPLQYAYRYFGTSGAKLLLSRGAHLDTRGGNLSDYTLIPGKRNALKVKNSTHRVFLSESELLALNSPLPLMCQCSHVIVRERIPYYRLNLPPQIKDFIKMH